MLYFRIKNQITARVCKESLNPLNKVNNFFIVRKILSLKKVYVYIITIKVFIFERSRACVVPYLSSCTFTKQGQEILGLQLIFDFTLRGEVFRLTPKLRAESTGSKYVMISHSLYDLKLQVEQQSQGLLLESGTD